MSTQPTPEYDLRELEYRAADGVEVALVWVVGWTSSRTRTDSTSSSTRTRTRPLAASSTSRVGSRCMRSVALKRAAGLFQRGGKSFEDNPHLVFEARIDAACVGGELRRPRLRTRAGGGLRDSRGRRRRRSRGARLPAAGLRLDRGGAPRPSRLSHSSFPKSGRVPVPVRPMIHLALDSRVQIARNLATTSGRRTG